MFNILPATEPALSTELAKANGAILYEGPSQLDGKPIVVIATGITKASRNSKTGAMVQTYVLRSDVHPIEAVKTGQDVSICGQCRHRGDGTGKGRSCYVTLAHGPRSVFDGYKRGIYPKATASEAAQMFAGKMIRLGTYGDPAAAPFALWKTALLQAKGWTGYTHQWSTIPARWHELVMASADTLAEMEAAQEKGYRTFRVTAEPFENVKGKEVICPASEERGKAADCFSCRACMGTGGKAKASIQIAAHGTGKKHVN
jgi:hypothetical protein